MIRVSLLILALASIGFAKSDFSIFEAAEIPSEGVFDPLDWLGPEKRTELEASHLRALEKWGVKVFVVILPERPTSEARVFAQKVGTAWGEGGTWGVLLHVVGDAESPWCAAERGKDLRWTKQEEFDRALESAMSRAHREPDQGLSVMVGARELTDELGFLGIVSNRRNQMLGRSVEERVQRAGEKLERQKFVHRIWVIGAAIAFFTGLAVLIFFKSRSRARMVGYHFPQTTPRRRFHGPWSGGGNVLVNFPEETSEGRSRQG